MSSNVEQIVSRKLAEAPVHETPFPYCVVDEVFPRDFYQDIQENFPDPSELIPLEDTGRAMNYKERFVMEFKDECLARLPAGKRAFWLGLSEWLLGKSFRAATLNTFRRYVEPQFRNVPGAKFISDALVVEDMTNYKLGPHTDASRKVVTCLFYLPADRSLSEYGTSLYVPKSKDFRDGKGRHFPFPFFDRVLTVPFVPNTLLTFVKSDRSFHGVEPFVQTGGSRRLLMFDIQVRNADLINRDSSAKPLPLS